MEANRLLGQNFLVNKQKIQEIISFIPQEKKMLEIGPGTGALTSLINNKTNLTVIEIDKRSVDFLQKTMPEIKIIEGNCLKEKLESEIIFGNLPYNISSNFLLKLALEASYEEGYFMLQREVVDKLIAKPSTKEYGALSVVLQLHGEVTKLVNLSPTDFKPAPKVYSTFFKIKPKMKVSKELTDFIFKLFQNRRKKISNLVKFNSDKRPDQITPKEFLEIFELITKDKKDN